MWYNPVNGQSVQGERLVVAGADIDEIFGRLRRGCVEVIEEDELRLKLSEGRPLIVKLGADPSAPDLHLGHAVVLRKLRQFQDLGHEVVFVIGDFTGRVGDPTDREATRRQLDDEEVRKNAATYESQASRILDPGRARVAFNSSWLRPLTFEDVIRLASTQTVARMLEREDFKNRFAAERPIHLHEFFYPLMQGQDSVALGADVELGGTDQKFNLLMARDLMRESGLEPEVVMLMPLLVGTDGVKKMSKSLGNHIGISDPPDEMFGKVMSLPDDLIVHYLEVVTEVPMGEVRRIEAALEAHTMNPRDAKARLARTIVTDFWGAEAAGQADERFRRIFSEGALPEDMPHAVTDEDRRLIDILRSSGLVASSGEARRLFAEGAIDLDGEVLRDVSLIIPAGTEGVLRIGKRRFLKLQKKD